jgi:hypothetical protein
VEWILLAIEIEANAAMADPPQWLNLIRLEGLVNAIGPVDCRNQAGAFVEFDMPVQVLIEHAKSVSGRHLLRFGTPRF